jgi:predicted acetyltransferase
VWVGVQPTHTRRGTLTRLLDRLLREAPERGQPLASLHASEATIYGRFGFGVASESVAATITTRKTAPWRAPSAGGSLRILRHDEVLDVVPALYDRVARLRTGSVSRPEWWWHRFYADAIRLSSARGDKGHFVVVHTSTDGHDDGFASYELGWSDGFGEPPAGAGSVHDLWAASPAVEIELWRFLAGIDLIESWRAERPVDEAARWAMNDPRAYEVRARFDDQWIRLLDVDTCLAARRYGDASESVTLAVTDPMFASNNDRWTISADGAWRSDATPDLTVDVGVLSAAYLGGRSWHLLTAGSGAPLDPDRCDRLDALFRIGPPPFCGTGY